MKTIRNFTFIVAVLVMVSCSSDKSEDTENGEHASAPETSDVPVTTGKYKIKSGTIYFETSAGDLKGKKIVHFDDYGAKERVETYDGDEPLKGYNTSDGKTRYYIDLQKKTAWISDRNGGRGWEMQFHTWAEIERQGNRNNDFKRIDNVTVAGKDCEAYEYGGIVVYAGWQGLTLYQKQKPDILVQAVKLEENVSHSPSLFEVPEGFEVKATPTYN